MAINVFASKTVTTDTPSIPHHVAIIMDGNGRWAKKRHLPKIAGHRKGAEALRNLLRPAYDLGIHQLTVYAFSSENWQRPEDEVSDLMQLLKSYLKDEIDTLVENNIRLKIAGQLDKIPEDTRQQIKAAEARTQHGTALTLTICLSYGARQELTYAMQTIAQAIQTNTLQPSDITEKTIDQFLLTAPLPDPDLLIRTGGEKRLSNFLLWQSAYTELYFCDTLWPDFTAEHLHEACNDFAKRERRYGTTS